MAKRRRRVRSNPLTKQQKLLIAGGVIVAAGGAAALVLTQRPSAPAQGPAADPNALKAQECAAIEAALSQLRASPTPDRAQVQQLEQQLSTCIAQAREMGVQLAASTVQLSTGDGLFNNIETYWAEYKGTDYSDALKRNNVRGSILSSGEQMVAAYQAAVAQSESDAQTQLARASVIRALDAAIRRRYCYLLDQPGCGRFAANEPHGNDKASDETRRVIEPLLAAHDAAVTKLGGAGRERAGRPESSVAFVNALLNECRATNEFLAQQFASYKATDATLDPLKRNNTRLAILAFGRQMVACLDNAYRAALQFNSPAALAEVASVASTALDGSMTRYLCFLSGTGGCQTVAANEDQPDAKASQERASITSPLEGLLFNIANSLLDQGSRAGFGPLIAAKMKAIRDRSSYLDGKFREFKGVLYADFNRRNNIRGNMLATGADLASSLQQALSWAIASARPTPVSALFRGGLSRGVLASRRFALPSPSGLTPIPADAKPRATATTAPAMGAVPFLPKVQFGPPVTPTVPAPPGAARALVPSTTPAVQGRLGAANPAGVAAVRDVYAATLTELSRAVARRNCYFKGQPGCDRDGVGEPHGFDKANEEQSRVIKPLLSVATAAADYLSKNGDPQAETRVMQAALEAARPPRDYADAQFDDLRRIDYMDPEKRNIVFGQIMTGGRQLVAVLKDLQPKTDAGKALVRSFVQEAADRSSRRERCFREGAQGLPANHPGYGCGRMHGTEGDPKAKGDMEANTIGNPLRSMLSDKTALGDAGSESVSPLAWLAIGAVGVLVVSAFARRS